MSNSLQPHRLQHTKPPCPPLSLRVCSNSCPLRRWCYPTVSSSVARFSCLQFFPALGSFSVSQIPASGSQSIGASASASVLPMNIYGGFPLGLTGFISLLCKGLSRIFSSTTVWKYLFILQCPTFILVKFSHLYMTNGKCWLSSIFFNYVKLQNS